MREKRDLSPLIYKVEAANIGVLTRMSINAVYIMQSYHDNLYSVAKFTQCMRVFNGLVN